MGDLNLTRLFPYNNEIPELLTQEKNKLFAVSIIHGPNKQS